MRISDWSSDVCSSDLTATTATTAVDPNAPTSTTAPPLTDLSTTPREEDLPDETVILEELDADGEPVAKYLLGPAAATGTIVQDARAVLQGAPWTVALEIKGGAAIDPFTPGPARQEERSVGKAGVESGRIR